MRHAPLSNEQILQALSESYNVVAAITKYQVFLTSAIGLPKDDAGRIELMAASMTVLEKIRTEIRELNMNLIVEKTRKNDVSNTNGVFAAANEFVHGPPRVASRKVMIWRSLVLHFCIRPIDGAFELLAIMDIRARSISFTSRPGRPYGPPDHGECSKASSALPFRHRITRSSA